MDSALPRRPRPAGKLSLIMSITMANLLRRFDQALCSSDPDLYRRLLVGAGEAAVAEAERVAGFLFPQALADLYSWRDGQRGKGTFPAGAGLGLGLFLSLRRAGLLREQLLARGRWEAGWWPVIDGGGGDLLAVELSAAETSEGREGRDVNGGGIVLFRHESPEPLLPFATVEEWLIAIVSRLEASSQELTVPPGGLASTLGEAPTLDDWSSLRAWLRSLAEVATPAAFARIALAVESPGPTDDEHPTFAALRTALDAWLASPSPSNRELLRRALTQRARTFIPRAQLRPILQYAAEAALAKTPTRACDQALHALAQAEPELVDGSLDDHQVGERCEALQRKILAALAG